MCYKNMVTKNTPKEKAMTLYPIVLFLHVVGALLLFVTLTVEGVALRQVRRAATTEAAQGTAALLRLNRIVGPLSALGVLVPGMYMTATTWAGWRGSWSRSCLGWRLPCSAPSTESGSWL
jgi:hypothetical protein